MKSKIIVTGKDGQLGWELMQIATQFENKYDFIFTGRNELDFSNINDINSFIEQHQPQYFINCAAYTTVDKAEAETKLANTINAYAPQAIANACKKINCTLIHISTDYVFDGEKKSPYLPTDEINPLNVYGSSKAMGERLVAESGCNVIVIRTSWVYSSFGKNFVKTMLRLMSERDEISVVDDQVGCPTYAADLAEAIMQIIAQVTKQPIINSTIYHYSNTGNISWFNFAAAIKVLGNKNCNVKPIPSSSYPTPARRSSYSVMDTSAIENDFNIEIKDWRSSLKNCIDLINKQN